MNILRKIVARKKKTVAESKERTPISELEKSPFFERKCISLSKNLNQSETGIIAEFKRKSPSKGWINENADIEEVAKCYETAGASGISVLTDQEFFAGSNEDLTKARQTVQLPILRKDFVIDKYQLAESKAIGADVVLLIAACLQQKQTKELAKFAQTFGLEVLLEVHDEAEINSHLNEYVNMVGVNNRNLNNFFVDVNQSLKLVDKIPTNFVKISESGLDNIEAIAQLRNVGYQGFLIGENFMRDQRPGHKCKEFINNVNHS
ncbi:MAG: indole-3-glycerol phosphate synthase [Flavobacteriales bacterium]|nr:MAG: indole-3-glycerol phosphate synthase [Flavobacteriales bacterium]